MNPARLTQLRLQNFRLFAELELSFHPELTVLVAANAGGKTSILDAIAKGFAPTIYYLHRSKPQTWFHQTDIRKIPVRNRSSMELQVPAWIEMQAEDKKIKLQWIDGRTQNNIAYIDPSENFPWGEQFLQHQQTPSKSADPILLPCIAYYGTERLWGERDPSPTPDVSQTNSRLSGYQNCLIPTSGYTNFAAWFRDRSFDAWQEETSGDPGLTYHPAQSLKAVQEAVITVLEEFGWNEIRWSTAIQGVTLKHKERGWFSVAHTSDGVTNVVGMVADLAHRCVRLNPETGAEAARETPGVVLIDEVDMHLHPRWQQVILGSLRRAFPKIQFVVTTHSPQVLSTVRRENIRVIEMLEEGKYIAQEPMSESYAESSHLVMERVMEVPAQPSVEELGDLQRLTELVGQGIMGEETTRLWESLNKRLGEQHSQLQRLRRSLRRRV